MGFIMAGRLSERLKSSGPSVYYSKGFRTAIEDHLLFLRNSAYTQKFSITAILAHRHTGNFYSLLNALGIEPYLHWVYLRLNGLTTPSQYRGELSLLAPSTIDIDPIKIRQQSLQTN